MCNDVNGAKVDSPPQGFGHLFGSFFRRIEEDGFDVWSQSGNKMIEMRNASIDKCDLS